MSRNGFSSQRPPTPPMSISRTLANGSSGQRPPAPPPASLVPIGCPYTAYTAVSRGGFGTVFRVRARTGDEYALKNVTAGLGALTPLEIDVSCRLKHPNLAGAVAVVSKGEIAPCPGMESFNLGLLMHFYTPVSSLTFPPAGVQTVMGQLADGLHYLHTQGFLHLDIKLANTLYDAITGQAMISDFGLNTYMGSALSVFLARPIGTTAWMAPEIADAPFRATRATDVYSLGVLFYELITKRVIPVGVQGPPKGMDKAVLPALTESLRVGRLKELRTVTTFDAALVSLTMDMLSAQPQRRPRLVEVMTLLRHTPFPGGFAEDQAMPSASTILLGTLRARGDIPMFSSIFINTLNYLTTVYPRLPVRVLFLAFDLFVRILPTVEDFEEALFFAACVYLAIVYTIPRTTYFPVSEYLARNPDLTTTPGEFETYLLKVIKATDGKLNRSLLCDTAVTVPQLQQALEKNVVGYFEGLDTFPEASPMAYNPTFEEFTQVAGRP